MDQLVERSPLIPEVGISNQVIGKKFYWTFTVNCFVTTKIKKKRPGIAHSTETLSKSFKSKKTKLISSLGWLFDSFRIWLFSDWRKMKHFYYLVRNDKCIFEKMCQPQPLFVYFRSFQANYIILLQINVKNVMSIQYMAPGFEPTTSQTWVVSRNHWTSAPLLKLIVKFLLYLSCEKNENKHKRPFLAHFMCKKTILFSASVPETLRLLLGHILQLSRLRWGSTVTQ